LININTDINSIFPIIINIIKNNFVLVKRLEKLISLTPYNEELVVFVSVSIDSLNEFSKLILSKINMLDKIKIPMKKDINIKKDKFIV
tara:strand:- start:151 stop:414 length:264 start_codon:yes stop_codon:yes gene_type:complete